MYDRLAKKWQQCGRDLSIDRTESDRIFQILVNAYTQPNRHYHNLTHIDRVLTTLDRFSATLQHPPSVMLAAWFHDFVYDSQAVDNELQSAKFANTLLTNLLVDRESIDRVNHLILATQGHQIDLNDVDRCIFLDADLAIFGADLVQYQSYQRSIRQEYSWVSDLDYQVGRIRVLESFLQRDRLYYTDSLFNELESIARTNLSTEILHLKNTI